MKTVHLFSFLSLFILVLESGCTTTLSRDTVWSHDRELTRQVLDRLQEDDITDSVLFQATTKDGIVTLYGLMPNHQVRARALSIVRSITGVQGVIDHTD
ncbi:MAG: BON domain-containing protein [Kiritimatiellae bacterium]|nr:BON domain-containing protein [Kiritimatiellia bacterium]